MSGTKIEGIKLTKVVDGDTIKVAINGESESLRLIGLDTEESWPGGSKPVTTAGKQASNCIGRQKSTFRSASRIITMNSQLGKSFKIPSHIIDESDIITWGLLVWGVSIGMFGYITYLFKQRLNTFHKIRIKLDNFDCHVIRVKFE
jgi:hypothetical protein